jgi:hypothetical protein
LTQQQVIRHAPRAAKIRVEMAAEYEEFITGKKNGKLNKISKSTGVQLDLFSPNQVILQLILTSAALEPVFDAFRQLKVTAILNFFISG